MKLKNNIKILVTGGAGMIGSNLVKKLVNDGFEVFVADNLWREKENIYILKRKYGHTDKNFYQVDLSNYDNCLRVTNNMDIVIHLADIVAGINYVFSNENQFIDQIF